MTASAEKGKYLIEEKKSEDNTKKLMTKFYCMKNKLVKNGWYNRNKKNLI